MKITNRIRTIVSIAFAVLAAGSARATMVAGWDFSQWAAPGQLTTDGANPANTLPANYSNLDQSLNLGPDSGAFGTLYFNGLEGSTEVVPDGTGNEAFVPSAGGSLTSNVNAPQLPPAQCLPAGSVCQSPFDSLAALQAAGQLPFQNLQGMVAQAPVSVVFQADLTSVLGLGEDWSLSFGGKTLSGTTSVGIQFSTDGSAYTSAGSVDLTTNDTPFNVALGVAGPIGELFVRLVFANAGTSNLPTIDNVAISVGSLTLVPEPGTAVLLLSGLAGLWARGRRRS
jgi:hypothetical protein